MQHNEEDYPNADAFLPDRWIKDGQIDPNVKDPIVATLYCRRLCPGRFFSDNTVSAIGHYRDRQTDKQNISFLLLFRASSHVTSKVDSASASLSPSK